VISAAAVPYHLAGAIAQAATSNGTNWSTTIIAALGSSAFVAVIAWWRFKKVDDATAAKTVSEAAAQVMNEIRLNGTQLSRELVTERDANQSLRTQLAQAQADVAGLRAQLSRVEADCAAENDRLRARLVHLEEVLTAHGLNGDQ
jgi:septal ring factor EnvC (AmiA/AmiB activator)